MKLEVKWGRQADKQTKAYTQTLKHTDMYIYVTDDPTNGQDDS